MIVWFYRYTFIVEHGSKIEKLNPLETPIPNIFKEYIYKRLKPEFLEIENRIMGSH